MKTDRSLLTKEKIIAATRSDEEFSRALKDAPTIIFDLAPDLMSITNKVAKAHEAGKKYLLHIDLAKGLGKDESGIRFLKRVGVDGIISTKANMIKLARESGIYTVQRFFIVDSRSVDTTVETIKSAKPDMVEIMPGIVYKVISSLKVLVDVPIIAGGLIDRAHEVGEALVHGAAAVSTGYPELWNMKL